MKTIGGLMDYTKLMPAQPAAVEAESDQIPVEHRPPAAASMSYDLQAHHHFHAMPHDQQVQAIRRLAAAGQGDQTIARATGLSVEQIRRLMAERTDA